MNQKILWVVKLGGSLAESPHLPRWLDALSQTEAVIVPGGGPFADAVREAQACWGFDDHTAHHMAILAMRQYGLMLAGLNPKLMLAETQALYKHSSQARIWLPDPRELDQAGIPVSWDVTSDTLAAWLTTEIQAANLLLVKSVALKPTTSVYRFAQLLDQGWVDPVFEEYAANQCFQSWLCGSDEFRRLAQGTNEPNQFFARIR